MQSSYKFQWSAFVVELWEMRVMGSAMDSIWRLNFGMIDVSNVHSEMGDIDNSLKLWHNERDLKVQEPILKVSEHRGERDRLTNVMARV